MRYCGVCQSNSRIVYQSVSLRCEPLKSQRGHAGRRALVDVPASSKCPLYERRSSRGVDTGGIGGVILRYNGTVQENTKFVAYCYSLCALAPRPAMRQLHQLFNFPSQITGKDKPRVSDACSRAVSCHDCRGGVGGEIRSSSETLSNLQVGMLSHKALSVSDLKSRGEKRRQETNRVRLFSQ